MLISTLQSIFERDLKKLYEEIEAYQKDLFVWYFKKNISNSAGNLCLHIIGNLNTYIGAEIGKTGYVRNREQEFSLTDVPRAELLLMISNTAEVVKDALATLSEKDLQKEYPIQVFDHPVTTEYFLVHLTTHLTYHLGQINYHRRLLDRKL